MKEEIIKESDKAKDFYGSTDVIGLKTLFRILDNQPDYKSAWNEIQNEIKEQINLLENWCGDCSICKSIPEPNENIKYSDLDNKLQELEQKYNLGGE